MNVLYFLSDFVTPRPGTIVLSTFETYLTALLKYARASWNRFSASKACPTLLYSLAFSLFTFNPDVNIAYSDDQSQFLVYVFTTWVTIMKATAVKTNRDLLRKQTVSEPIHHDITNPSVSYHLSITSPKP